MFAPEATTARSIPRRRVRATTSDESLGNARPSTKRRKRSALASDTFEASSAATTNNSGAANGHAKLPNGRDAASPSDEPPSSRATRETSVDVTGLPRAHARGSKRGDRRGASGRELGLLQAETDHYSVWKDSEFPTALHNAIAKEPWRADFVHQLGYAVALTPTQAILWPYSREASFNDGSKALTIKLPFQSSPSRYSKDPLPLSALVHDTGVGELALLAVAPASGKLIYWESVANAAKADAIRQRQQGIHGAISGLFSSEQIKEIIEAEPDGFVLTTTYGRIIHLSVRDLQGRPHISSTVLQTEEATNTGFFGSLRTAFTGSWRKEVAAARAAPASSKSSRRCMVAYANGLLETWELTRHGSKALESEVNATDAIHKAVVTIHPQREEMRNNFRILDFTFSTLRIRDRKHHNDHRIMLLCSYNSGEDYFYYVVDGILQTHTLKVEVVHPISRWPKSTGASLKGQDPKLRLLVPEPEHTAYVVGEECVVLVSLRDVEETPDVQLQLEAETISEPFQDILMLNTKRSNRVIASAIRPADRESEKATCYLLVDHFGLVRITALPAIESESMAARRAYLCRSQIEQGVFFGGVTDNLLDFSSGLDSGTWTDEEIEENTLTINNSIVNNQSKRIPPMSPSMERQLQTRALWLRQLIAYVDKARLSGPARWRLLWSAEKMAAAEAVWTSYSEFLRTKNLREKLLLPELLDIMLESVKHENNPERGETDIVRHYLLNDIARIELLVPYAEHALQELENEGSVKNATQEARLLLQAIELQTVILRTAFKFRKSNCAVYGFSEASFDEGIYQGDYADLPYFWTSPQESPRRLKQLLDSALNFATKQNEVSSPVEGEDVELDLLALVISSVPALIGLSCDVYEERCRWLAGQGDPDSEQKAEALREEYHDTRGELIVRLVTVDLEEDGFTLGERYHDMDALAELLARADAVNLEILNNPASPEEDQHVSNAKLVKNKGRVEQYFKAYGDDWANAMFGREIEVGEASNLLAQPYKYRDYVSRYLENHPELRKLRWMNEVGQMKYDIGSEILFDCSRKEDTLWARKVNLSMAKLCKLAAHERKLVDRAGMLKTVHRADRRLAIAELQEQLYDFTQPTIQNAIDASAAVELATESYGSFVQEKPYLSGVLKANLAKLMERRCLDAEELMDTLTLIAPDARDPDVDSAFVRERFFLAFKLLKLTAFEGGRRELHERIIWRRCLLQDDWATFNHTENQTDEEVAKVTEDTIFFQTLKAGYANGLFETLTPIPPAQIFGAGVDADSLRSSAQYASASDDLVEALAVDLQVEDEALEEAVEKGRLELWWPGVVDGAKLAVRKEQDAAREQAAREEMERSQPSTGLGESEEKDTQESVDAEGDVFMG